MFDDFSPLKTLLPNVPRGTFSLLQKYVELVFKWNAKTNLTGAKNVQDFCLHHVVDCAAALSATPPFNVCLDVGSGSGLPGLVWACLCPDKTFYLIESLQKKAAFLHRAVSVLGLHNVQVFATRFENLSQELPRSLKKERPLIVSRGTMSPPNLLKLISKSPIDFQAWLIFSSQKTHQEFLTLTKNSEMEVEDLHYSKDLEEKNSGMLTRISY